MEDIRRALRWSWTSVIWTLGSSTVSIATGVAVGSLLLVTFGLVGALDLVGSVVLVVHFRHARRHETVDERRERLAVRVIALGMAGISVGASIQGVRHLMHHGPVRSSLLGATVVGASVPALALLAMGKSRVARRLASRALLADSHVSAMGALLAAFTVSGTTATAAFGWWWLDPIGSLAVALVGTAVAVSHARSA